MAFRRKKNNPDNNYNPTTQGEEDIPITTTANEIKSSAWERANHDRDGFCKNCGKDANENFCPNCGQKSDTGRLEFLPTAKNFASTIFNVEAGVVKTSLMLFVRPGFVAKDYIEGKRKSYTNPFSLMVLLAGIYVILFLIILWTKTGDTDPTITTWGIIKFNLPSESEVGGGGLILLKVFRWLGKTIVIPSFLMLPVFAFFTRLVFRSSNGGNYNFTEIMYASAFLASQRFTIDMAALPFRWLLGDNSDDIILPVVTIFYFAFTALTFKQLFGIGWISTLFKTLLMFILSILLMCAVIVFSWFLVTGQNIFDL